MIVSRKMAEDAAKVMHLEFNPGGMTEQMVKDRYKVLAKELHPDKGGDPAAFVEADRAKCILLGWLERRAKEEPGEAAVSSNTCPMCHGTGRRTLRRGFRSMTMLCGTCRGHGELLPNDKVEE